MSDMGRVNVEFDKQILQWIREGDMDALVSLTDEEIVEQAGNGALEIKHLICAMAALPDARAEIIAYEPIPEWVTGLGFAELKPAA
jgi:protocatechuate 4,5-dioxygenase beta chain